MYNVYLEYLTSWQVRASLNGKTLGTFANFDLTHIRKIVAKHLTENFNTTNEVSPDEINIITDDDRLLPIKGKKI